jgi:hypothetical protein
VRVTLPKIFKTVEESYHLGPEKFVHLLSLLASGFLEELAGLLLVLPTLLGMLGAKAGVQTRHRTVECNPHLPTLPLPKLCLEFFQGAHLPCLLTQLSSSLH